MDLRCNHCQTWQFLMFILAPTSVCPQGFQIICQVYRWNITVDLIQSWSTRSRNMYALNYQEARLKTSINAVYEILVLVYHPWYNPSSAIRVTKTLFINFCIRVIQVLQKHPLNSLIPIEIDWRHWSSAAWCQWSSAAWCHCSLAAWWHWSSAACDSCQTWTWYSTANRCFDDSEKLVKQAVTNPYPRSSTEDEFLIGFSHDAGYSNLPN